MPFDLPEAESELVAGFHTEYASFKFAMFFIAEYTSMITVSCLCSIMFFGGWLSPFPASLDVDALSALGDSDSVWLVGHLGRHPLRNDFRPNHSARRGNGDHRHSAQCFMLLPGVNEFIQGPFWLLVQDFCFPVHLRVDARHASAFPL